MFFSIAFNFIIFSFFSYQALGYIFSLVLITVAAAETAIGLSLLILASRFTHVLSYDFLTVLKG